MCKYMRSRSSGSCSLVFLHNGRFWMRNTRGRRPVTRSIERSIYRVQTKTHPSPYSQTRSKDRHLQPHRRRRMLERESDKMLGVKMHLLGRDDESEVVQEQELELELVELWKGEAAYLKTSDLKLSRDEEVNVRRTLAYRELV